jgi:hypothetical protein
MHVQLGPSQEPTGELPQGIVQTIPAHLRPERVVLWKYREFPFGMTLDYERKFTHYVAGERVPDTRAIA